ncbi:MAG: hypothetical protein H6811_04625 [Phycisphaeraceae bacterium]|nr:hypothetical protein [Phycisphaeraceae bacterium]
MHLRLGDILVLRGVLTEEQLVQALDEQSLSGRPIGEIVERVFGVSPMDVERAWESQYAQLAPSIDPLSIAPDPDCLSMISRRQAWQFRVLPAWMDGRELAVVTCEGSAARLLRFAAWRISSPCSMVLAEPQRLGLALMRHYPMAGMTPVSAGLVPA